MAKDKAGLYVDTQDLFRLLYETQFEIPKRDRIALTNRMLDHCEKIIGYFALTYYVEEDKLRHIDSFIAEFEALFPLPYYAYNAGQLLSVTATGIKTVGFNAYNPETGKAILLGGHKYQVSGTYTALDFNGAAPTLDGEGCVADHEGRFISSLYLARWFKLSSALGYGGYKGRGCVLT